MSISRLTKITMEDTNFENTAGITICLQKKEDPAM
jgi:hypothetical protein